MNALLAWLFGFFILGVGEGEGADEGVDTGGDAGTDAGADEGADEGADAGGEEDTGASEDDLHLDDAGDDDTSVAAAAEQASRELREANEKTARLEQELAAARRPQGAAAVTDDQRAFEAEEAKLRDPKTTELERWQIQSNRTLRANKQASSMALFQAQDLSDRTNFNQLAITKPAIHKRYAARVEAEIARMRQNGQNAPREAVLRYLIGNDALEGKLSGKKATAAAADTNTINRGKSPGARSDVASKGRLTESQRREKRLEGVQI